MDEAIRKASVLIEALAWIRRFRGRYVVIKLGGSALEETEAVKRFLADVIFMETVGMKPILIHGGGKAISQAMNEAGIEPRFVQGRRYTDDQTLDIAARVLAEDICRSLVRQIRDQGGHAVELSYATQNCLIGEKLTLPDEKGNTHRLGRGGAGGGFRPEPVGRHLPVGLHSGDSFRRVGPRGKQAQRQRRHRRRRGRPVAGGGEAGVLKRRAGNFSRSKQTGEFDFPSER